MTTKAGERGVDKAARLIHLAAYRGAQLAVLPECFIPPYPSKAWGRGAAGFGGWDELWERLWAKSVDALRHFPVSLPPNREVFGEDVLAHEMADVGEPPE
jgi:Carbon-nitrogen hydrolase